MDSQIALLKRWRLSTFFVCLFGYVGYYICRKNLSAALPLISAEFGYSNSELGLIALYSELSYAAGKFINGPLGDKIGGRKIFLIGMLGAIGCNLLFSLGYDLIYFIIIWCVCRYFLSMGWGGLVKMIGNWYEPEKNGTVMGLISLNFQFGGVVATLFAGLIVAMGGGWRDIFIYPAGVLILIFIWSYFGSKDSPQDVVAGTEFGKSAGQLQSILEESNTEVGASPIKKLLRLRLFKVLLAYSFLTTFLRSIFFFWTPKLLVDLGMGTSNAILKSALFPLLGCLGTIFIGWYTDKHSKDNRAKMMWKMLMGLAVCLVALVFIIKYIPYEKNLLVLFLSLSGFFLLGPYSMSSGCLTLDIAGSKAAGSATGVIDGLGYIGGALAVWSAGAISDQLGWAEVFALLSLCSLLAVICAVFMSYEFEKKIKEKII
jgi:OPA family glycerol-3-phosphate transporter-like MFS transporter